MKGFEKTIKHPLFKYAMYTLAVINLYGYTTKKKFNCLLLFVTAVMVTHYFIKNNIPLALLVGLIISSFVLGCGKILEGQTPRGVHQKIYGSPGQDGYIEVYKNNWIGTPVKEYSSLILFSKNLL